MDVFNQGMYKTELCNKWQETGTCPYSQQCQFAHGVSELRPVIRHPRYKTQVCRMVLSGVPCPYGHRCHFRHSLSQCHIFISRSTTYVSFVYNKILKLLFLILSNNLCLYFGSYIITYQGRSVKNVIMVNVILISILVHHHSNDVDLCMSIILYMVK